MRFAIQTLVMIALSTPAFATETHCKGNEANLRMVEEMTEVLFNKRDEGQASKYYAPEIISHNADRGGGMPIVFQFKCISGEMRDERGDQQTENQPWLSGNRSRDGSRNETNHCFQYSSRHLHVVGAEEHPAGEDQAECPDSLHVDGQLKLRVFQRAIDRQQSTVIGPPNNKRPA